MNKEIYDEGYTSLLDAKNAALERVRDILDMPWQEVVRGLPLFLYYHELFNWSKQ